MNGVQRSSVIGLSAGDLVDGFSQALHIATGNASNRDPAILGSVDRILEEISIAGSAVAQIYHPTSWANWSICVGVNPVYANIPI